MSDALGRGYLGKAEANRIQVKAAPDLVFLTLIRDFPGEGQATRMFCELFPATALRLSADLARGAKRAMALAGV